VAYAAAAGAGTGESGSVSAMRLCSASEVSPPATMVGLTSSGAVRVSEASTFRSLFGVFALDFLVDFLAIDADVVRPFDAELDAAGADVHDCEADVMADDDLFAGFSREHEHWGLPP